MSPPSHHQTRGQQGPRPYDKTADRPGVCRQLFYIDHVMSTSLELLKLRVDLMSPESVNSYLRSKMKTRPADGVFLTMTAALSLSGEFLFPTNRTPSSSDLAKGSTSSMILSLNIRLYISDIRRLQMLASAALKYELPRFITVIRNSILGPSWRLAATTWTREHNHVLIRNYSQNSIHGTYKSFHQSLLNPGLVDVEFEHLKEIAFALLYLESLPPEDYETVPMTPGDYAYHQ